MSRLESYIAAYKKAIEHPFFDKGAIERLIKEYETYGNLIIGFDFDNTIFDYHNKGGNYSKIISLLQDCKELGFTLCLYTLELNEERLKWKILYCKYYGIEPSYVNDSPILKGHKKPFFNVLLDDRAGLESSYNILKAVVDYEKTLSRDDSSF